MLKICTSSACQRKKKIVQLTFVVVAAETTCFAWLKCGTFGDCRSSIFCQHQIQNVKEKERHRHFFFMPASRKTALVIEAIEAITNSSTGENAWLLNVKEGGLFWAILEQTNIWKFVHRARNKVIFYIFFLVKIWETNDKVKDQSKKLIFVLFCATETERKLGQITMCWKKSWDHHHLFVKGAFPQTALDVRLWNCRFCVLNISSRLGLASNAIKIMSTSGGL